MAETGKGTRRHVRLPDRSQIRLTWHMPDGSCREFRGRCMDLSEAGFRFESPDPIPVGTYVKFRIDRDNLAGSASVRHCRREGMKYTVGAEFSRSLRWSGARPHAESA